jgi:hypothetical protein
MMRGAYLRMRFPRAGTIGGCAPNGRAKTRPIRSPAGCYSACAAYAPTAAGVERDEHRVALHGAYASEVLSHGCASLTLSRSHPTMTDARSLPRAWRCPQHPEQNLATPLRTTSNPTAIAKGSRPCLRRSSRRPRGYGSSSRIDPIAQRGAHAAELHQALMTIDHHNACAG